jgi:hypothetical protein
MSRLWVIGIPVLRWIQKPRANEKFCLGLGKGKTKQNKWKGGKGENSNVIEEFKISKWW